MREYGDNDCPHPEINIIIDDKNIIDIIGEHESIKGYSPAGGYFGLRADHIDPNFYQGKSEAEFGASENKTPILDCSCGSIGCWTLVANIHINDESVVWDDFENVHRNSESISPEWDYSSIKFHFNRKEYMEQFSVLTAATNSNNKLFGNPTSKHLPHPRKNANAKIESSWLRMHINKLFNK